MYYEMDHVDTYKQVCQSNTRVQKKLDPVYLEMFPDLKLISTCLTNFIHLKTYSILGLCDAIPETWSKEEDSVQFSRLDLALQQVIKCNEIEDELLADLRFIHSWVVTTIKTYRLK